MPHLSLAFSGAEHSKSRRLTGQSIAPPASGEGLNSVIFASSAGARHATIAS